MSSFGSLGKKIRSGKGCSRVPCDPRGISREQFSTPGLRDNFMQSHPELTISHFRRSRVFTSGMRSRKQGLLIVKARSRRVPTWAGRVVPLRLATSPLANHCDN